MKKIRALMACALVALALTSCSALRGASDMANTPIGAQTVADARNSLAIIENGYAVALVTATAYVRLPPCGRPTSPPACSSTAVVKQLARAQSAVSATITNAHEVVLNSTESTSALRAAIAAAGGAYDSFKAIMAQNGVK